MTRSSNPFGRLRPAGSQRGGERCPACPHRGLTGIETTCPSCGTDLTPLRAVQHLPEALFSDGVAFARDGDLARAAESLTAASALDSTGKAARAILRAWRDACPNPQCPHRGRVEMGNIRLLDPDPTAPLWRCDTCGHVCGGTGAGAAIRVRLSVLPRRSLRPVRRALGALWHPSGGSWALLRRSPRGRDARPGDM